MAGVRQTIQAPTKTELRNLVREWQKRAKDSGISDIRLGYDPERVVKTDGGYSIEVWAHA